jgi:hypothetical protein
LWKYLTQTDLPGNPCTNSAWTHMRAVGNDETLRYAARSPLLEQHSGQELLSTPC